MFIIFIIIIIIIWFNYTIYLQNNRIKTIIRCILNLKIIVAYFKPTGFLHLDVSGSFSKLKIKEKVNN
jgi:hypothetical protein